MKKIFTLIVSAWILFSYEANGQIAEKFNSRPGVSLSQVKGYLEGRCWIFRDFDTNKDGWVPAIEGDGAMVSGPNPNDNYDHQYNSGILTPLLNIPGFLTITFKYKIDAPLAPGERRWFRIFLATEDNTIAGPWIDSVEITNAATSTITYNRHFPQTGSGLYKIYIQYAGNGIGTTRIAIDQITADPPLYHTGGCTQPPIAVNDAISGTNTHTANGKVTVNDSDPNGQTFSAYLVTPSPDGTVILNPDGTFTFTPNPGFTGNSTTFQYKICNNNYPGLCSNIATVTLNFPTGGSLPVTLIDFKGLYKDDGDVELSWITTFEANSDRFEIERSYDGSEWSTVGTVNAQGNSSTKVNYSFVDKVGNNANKKDLYYQLRQVDKDGRVHLSKMLLVRVYNTRALKMVSVTPNPVVNDINVTIQLNESSFVVMKVFNTAGTELMRKTTKAGKGSFTTAIDNSSTLRPGLYLLEVTINSKERMVIKLLKE